MTYHGLRVAFLCSADSFRGSAVSLQHLAHGLEARSAVVRMLTGHAAVTEPLRAEGIDVVQLDLRSTNLRAAWRLRRELRAFDAEVLLVDRPRDLRLGLLATIGTKVALVSRYNSHAPSPPRDFLTRLAYRLRVRDTVFLTHEMAKRILAMAPWMRRAAHRVIPEGVCLDAFRRDAALAAEFRARHALGDAPFVLTVGALRPEKRIDMIIDAMHRLSDAPTLVVCGEGPLLDAYHRVAALLNVKVRFLGRVSRTELRGAYSAASVVAHACAVETFGLSVLEAMACGAPVVGVRAGGLRELVGDDADGAGVLVAHDDVDAMRNAIDEVLHDAVLAASLGDKACQRAAKYFALDRMADGYERVVLAAYTRRAVST